MASGPEGEVAVRLAREAVGRALGPDAPRDPSSPFHDRGLPALFDTPMGVFVTLGSYPSGALRGCIGYPIGVYPLRVGLPRIAAAAARDDPRFPPVEPEELARITIEVSLLTPPEPLESSPRASLPDRIRVGVDGLIVDGHGASGLLLPQVAPEQGWNALEFLRETCVKGGLPPNAWLSPEVRVRRFGAERFREDRPGGPVRAEGVTAGAPASSG